MQRGVAIGPVWEIGHSVKARIVGKGASRYLHQRRSRGWEAIEIVSIGPFYRRAYPLRVPRWTFDTVKAARNGGAITVVKVADLIGECDVIGMRRPDDASVLRGGAVHRMEVIGNVFACS